MGTLYKNGKICVSERKRFVSGWVSVSCGSIGEKTDMLEFDKEYNVNEVIFRGKKK